MHALAPSHVVAAVPSARAAEALRRLATAYGPLHPKPRRDALSELIEVILSQNTSDANAARAFAQLRRAFPTWQALLDAPTERVADAIRSAGLSNVKAPRLQAVLRAIRERYGALDLDHMADLPLDEARAELTALPGVGPKSAACVLLFSLGLPALPVDTHVHRVALRLGLLPPKADAARAHALLEALVPPADRYAFHVALITHGRRTCHARRPRCPACPLADICPDYQARVQVARG
ncbi:MAG: endonuclease III [Chloroflexi bacterium]|nr:endonuclease III [Chloroflexota bacterium]